MSVLAFLVPSPPGDCVLCTLHNEYGGLLAVHCAFVQGLKTNRAAIAACTPCIAEIAKLSESYDEVILREPG